MKLFKPIVQTCLLCITILAAGVYAQDNLLDRVPELQRIAHLSNIGALGCGPSDYSMVFKSDTKLSQLLVLLNARAEANRTGKTNAMSGEVSDLVYVILSELPRFKDASVIPTVQELLADKDDVIRGWAAIALYRMARASDDLRKKIEPTVFPEAAVISARGRSEPLPTWAKTN